MTEPSTEQKEVRDYSVCWKTFVVCSKIHRDGEWEIFETDLEAAMKDLQERKIPIQYGDFVSFANAPNGWPKDGCYGYLYIFDGKKLLELSEVPYECGCVPKEFVCLDSNNFREPWSFMAHDFSKDNEVQEKRGPRHYTWFRPGPFLEQMQKNVTGKKTWFEYENKTYEIWNEIDDLNCENLFIEMIKNLKRNTLLWATPPEFIKTDNELAMSLHDYSAEYN